MDWLGADFRMAGGPNMRRTRRRWARRSGALALAALAQGGLLWLTTIQQRALLFPAAETRGLPVWIAPPSVLTMRRPPPARLAATTARAAPRAAVVPSVAPIAGAAGPPAAPGPAAPGIAAPSVPAGVASALRGSLIGCANTAALSLSDAERAGCRDRLAAGATTAAYRPGIPAAKGAYYAAVLAAEEDYRKHGGHPLAIACLPGARAHLIHAIKIGPCYIEPSQGPLTVDVDVPEMDGQHGAPPPPR
jgi:hypothetical protein